MAFTPFTESDQPTMANFNEKFQQAIAEAKAEALTAALAEDVHIATGSYTGTGTYGETNPTILTFDFPPKQVIIIGSFYLNGTTGKGALILIPGANKGIVISFDITNMDNVTFGEHGVSWSNSTSQSSGYYLGANQFNQINQNYDYVAIG